MRVHPAAELQLLTLDGMRHQQSAYDEKIVRSGKAANRQIS